MKVVVCVFCGFVLALSGWAQSPVFTLATPPATTDAGAPVAIELVALNPSASELPYAAPVEIAGRLVAGGKSFPVTLRRSDGARDGVIPAAGFLRQTYGFLFPAGITERSILEIDHPARLRAVLEVAEARVVAEAAAADSPEAQATPATSPEAEGSRSRPGLVPRTAASRIERTFREHFEPHEPVYFIYGAKSPNAKYQLSFKYRVFGDSPSDDLATTRNSLQFGYSQRSLWDITADSSPFVDTSYMPEVFFEHLGPEHEEGAAPFTWLGFQAGYQHESNGKDFENSRSLNTLFLRPAIALGELGGWRMIFAPRVFGYILDMSDNPDLKKYRGYGEARLIFGRNDGPELTVSARVGSGWHHATYQADLSYPLRFSRGGFASYLLVQYFNGYGESLISYNERTRILRAGFSFVR